MMEFKVKHYEAGKPIKEEGFRYESFYGAFISEDGRVWLEAEPIFRMRDGSDAERTSGGGIE